VEFQLKSTQRYERWNKCKAISEIYDAAVQCCVRYIVINIVGYKNKLSSFSNDKVITLHITILHVIQVLCSD